jgi:uncharacterized membrane protein YgcG
MRMPLYLLIPIVVLGSVLVVFGLLVFLARFRKGKYLKPLVTQMMKVPFLRRWFQKASTAALERQNPELASAMRKLQRIGPNVDPLKAQAALSQLSASERRAYMEAVDEQGGMPEAANRQMRRMQQRMQGGGTGSSGTGGGGTGGGSRPSGNAQRKRKKR